jgi:hypothetical protein
LCNLFLVSAIKRRFTGEGNMDLNDLTLGQIKEISGMCKTVTTEAKSFLEIGKCYLVRTVTFTVAGTLKAINDKEFLFTECDWIADTGRFSDNLKSCAFNEVEPYDKDVIVNRSSFTDATEIKSTPRKQK